MSRPRLTILLAGAFVRGFNAAWAWQERRCARTGEELHWAVERGVTAEPS
jgi:hypothetical protein